MEQFKYLVIALHIALREEGATTANVGNVTQT
jgi:hypothetical protein